MATTRDLYLRAARPNLDPNMTTTGLRRPLRPMPDRLAECQAYCRELQQEIWRLDRRWAQLRAAAQDADRQGHTIDVESFARALEHSGTV